MDHHKNNDHDDLLDQATDAMRASPIPAGPPDELVARVVASLQAQEIASRTQPNSLWTRISAMKPTTKLAVVAALVVAFLAVFSWWAPGGGNRALAFEDVAKAFSTIRTAKCRVTTTGKTVGPDGKTIPVSSSGSSMFLAPSRERVETTTKTVLGPMHMIVIFDSEAGKSVSQLPDQKMAIVTDLKNMPKGQAQGSFDVLGQMFANAQQDQYEDVQSLPERNVDGVVAQGFRFGKKSGVQVDIWAHPETAYPVYVETSTLGEPKMKTVMTDFEYNIKMDESLFSLDPPQGYTIRKMTLDASQTGIQALADILRFCAENSGGSFPKKLRGKEGIEGSYGRSMEEKAKQLTADGVTDPSELTDAFMPHTVKYSQANAFLMTLPPDGDWHYSAHGVKLGDANRAIFWHKPPGGETYEVIYGDLRIVKDVEQTDLPSPPSQ